MRRAAKPGFLLVARRELRWLLHDRVAIILIFGVPLFAFVVLSAVFSSPVIRGLGVVVVDEDRSETSRAFVEQVAASPGLSIVARAGDLATASRAIRSGDAIAAVYVPANFERDLKAERRPQVVAFYNQQLLTAAGIASSGMSDSLAAAASSVAPANRAAPAASHIGALVAETIVLVNPQRNYAQFLLRTLLPMVIHVVIAVAAGYAVGSEFRRRSMRTWLACAGGNPIVALAGKLAPLFAIFFVIMLTVPLVLEGLFEISFKGDVPMVVAAATLLIIGYLALGALLQLLTRDLPTGLGLTGLIVSPAFGYAGVGFPILGMNAFAQVWGAILPLRWYMEVLLGQAARGLPVHDSALPFAALAGVGRALHAAGAPSSARDRRKHESRGRRAGAGRPRGARNRRSLCGRVAARARDPRRLQHPGAGAAGLWRLLPAALPDPDPAQGADCGGRQRPERAQPRHRADAGRERGGEGGRHCGDARRRARGARPRRGLRRGRHPVRDAARRAQGHHRARSDLCRCHLSVHFPNDGQRHRGRDQHAVVRAAAGGARTDGSLVKAKLAAASPADILLQPIFNPVGGYASYIVPAAFVLILQQTLLMGAGMLTAAALAQASGGAFANVLGRGIAHLTIYLPALALYFIVLPRFYGFSALGHPLQMFALASLFILATSFMGQAVGAWFKRPETTTLIFLATSLPQFFLTGFSWPREAIPKPVYAAGHIFPADFAIDGIVRIDQLGANLWEVVHDWRGLWVLAIGYFALAVMSAFLVRRRHANG